MLQFFKQNKTQSTLMVLVGVALTVFLVAKTVESVVQTMNEGQPTPYEHQITFEGVGKAEGSPNVASINIGMETKAADVSSAQMENTKKTDAIFKQMEGLGVEKKDLKTTSYNVYAWNEWDSKNQTNVEKGWIVNQQLEVKVRDLEKVSKVLEAAGQSNSTYISGPNFVIDDTEELKSQARAKAIENAKQKAEMAAEALGMELGEVVGYWESMPMEPYAYGATYMMKDGMGGGMESAAPRVEPGSSEVQVNVSLTFRIED